MHTVHVAASTPYDVLVAGGLISFCGDIMRQRISASRIVLISDETVCGLYGKRVEDALRCAGFAVDCFSFKPGEASKSLATLSEILSFLAAHHITRSDAIVALGGGVTGDLAGFAAASYLRGIAFVQMPTTLLAAVDSSVGGKTGVDLKEGKNLVGAFWQPSLVLCDTDAFDTLSDTIYADGVAESIKHGVIADPELFDMLKDGHVRRDPQALVSRNVHIKAHVVAQDERESGVRQLLNLGHTIGHAVEHLSDFSVTHGKAVAIGMAMIARAAERMGIAQSGTAQQIVNALVHCGLPTDTEYTAEALAEAALGDKKRSGSHITLVLPERIGKCIRKKVPVTDLSAIFAQGKEDLSCM